MLTCASQASCCLPPSSFLPASVPLPPSGQPPSSFLPPSVPLHPPGQLFLPRGKGFVDSFMYPEIERAGSDELSLQSLASKVENITRRLLCEMVRCNGETIPKSPSHSVSIYPPWWIEGHKKKTTRQQEHATIAVRSHSTRSYQR